MHPYRLTEPKEIEAAIESAEAEGIVDLEGFYALYRYVGDAALRKRALAVLKARAPQLESIARGRSPFANAKGKKVAAALKKHEGSGLDVVRLALECAWWAQVPLGRDSDITPGNGAIYLFDQGPEVRRRALDAMVEHASLRIVDQELAKLPPEIVERTELVELNLNSNRLTKTRAPKDLDRLTNLRVLGWRHNGLSGIPGPILKMSELVVLQLGGNDFGGGGLPERWPFPRLKELDLGHNNLKAFPVGVTTLPELEVLDLSYNYFTDIPDALAQMRSLRELHLGPQPLSAAARKRIESLLPGGCQLKVGHGVKMQSDCTATRGREPTAAVRWGLLCRMCAVRVPVQNGGCPECLVQEDERLEKQQS